MVVSSQEPGALERGSGFSASVACELSPDTQGRVSAGQRPLQLGIRDVGMLVYLSVFSVWAADKAKTVSGRMRKADSWPYQVSQKGPEKYPGIVFLRACFVEIGNNLLFSWFKIFRCSIKFIWVPARCAFKISLSGNSAAAPAPGSRLCRTQITARMRSVFS